VLGSAQPASDLDERRCRDEGLSVVRRRSGGGAVLVEPGAQVWVDFEISPDDPLHVADVSVSFLWVGELWAAAIGAVLPPATRIEVVVPARAVPSSPFARTLCFAGVGAGEVLVEGKKAVGLSQRRDRSGARFHSMALLRDGPGRLAGLLSLPVAAQKAAEQALRARSGALPGGADVGDALATALVSLLP
jgi:lipoate-protein ligase A